MRGSTHAPSGRLDPDTYLTDGERLLRVVSHLEAQTSTRLTTLEDCRTLELRAYSPQELQAMRLSTVRRPDSCHPGRSETKSPTVPGNLADEATGTTPRDRSARIALQINRSSAGWDLVLPDHGQLVTCETLDDARRVAYLCGAHAEPCELIVRDHDRVHRELVGVQGSDG